MARVTLLGRAIGWHILTCLAAYLLLCVPATAQEFPTTMVEVDGPVTVDELIGSISGLRDPEGQLTAQDVLAPAKRSEFEVIAERAINFGYTSDVLWLALTVRNVGSPEDEWRLYFRENFFQLFEVFAVDEAGDIRTMESLTVASPYSDRDVSYPELVVPLELPPGAERIVLVRYSSGGSSELTMELMTENSFNAFATQRTARNFIYYGMILLLTLAAIAAFLYTRNGNFLAYSAYATCGLLFVMHGDGNAFQYLWPDRPLFNDSASILIGTGLIVFGGNFSRVFLQTRTYHKIFDAIILAVMAIALALAASSLVVDPQWVKKTLVLFAFLSMALYAVAGFNAARTRFREVRFYVLAWAGAVISSGIMTSRHWLGLDISADTQFNSMRIVLVVDAALMGLAILDRIEQLKRVREQSLKTSLEVTKRNLGLSTRLRELEKRYELALEVGERRERDMVDVIHDLRQPIHALRLSVQATVSGKSNSRDAGEVEDAFGYLESLVQDYLDTPQQSVRAAAAPEPDIAEWHSVDTVLEGLKEMIGGGAELKKVNLSIVPSGLSTVVPPLHLMRIASNLAQNAIRYASPGRLLIGMRRRGDGLAELQVHDTGPGLSAEEFKKAFQRAARLDPDVAPDGKGLGLSIVRDLCAQHGLLVRQIPREPGEGLSIAITLPAKNKGNP